MSQVKNKKKKPKRTRFIFDRNMSEDDMIKALKKMCKEQGIKFDPKKVRPRGSSAAKSITGEAFHPLHLRLASGPGSG